MEKLKEQRKHTRFDVDWPIQIDVRGRLLECITMNISAEGLYIRCNEPLPIDEVIYLSLKPKNHGPIEFYGKVIWSDLYGIDEKDKVYGIGVFFVQTAQKESKEFDDLVKSLKD